MKAIWKVLGITALAAAVPVRIKKDEATGTKRYQSLLLSVDVGPGENGEGTDIGLNLGEGVISSAISELVSARKEAKLFADDEPEAAVPDLTDLQVPAGPDEPKVDAVEAADEAQEDAGEAEEDAEAGPDPEF